MLAFTHPGKVGDLLYTLPTVKHICSVKNEVSDFYTSSYCHPIVKRLLERQSYISHCFQSQTYTIERMDMGVQPWRVPVDLSIYDATYHLGFRNAPDRPLPEFIANSVGTTWNGKIEYEFDNIPTMDEKYIVLASRGESSYKNMFQDLARKSPVKVVEIGSYTDYVGEGINRCGLDLLDTLPWIANSVGFVGLMSSQLVLANGFNIPKVAPHDGIHWDMNHVVKSPSNFYPVNPTAEQILGILGL